jgi:transposase
VVLFTETLDDAIPQNHPIRLLERCLDEVDWTLWENRYDGRRGQPPIHPRLVAGCILYGLMQGLRTTRTLEDATANRLDFTWFLERRTIDHSTFADFRVEFKKEPKDLNRQIGGMVCEGWMDALLELVVDGTRLRANSDRHGARTAQALDRLIAACEKELNEKLEKLAAENSEENLEKTDAETLAKGVATLEEKPEKYRKALAVAHERDEEKRRQEGKTAVAVRVPVTDPDSTLAPNKEGGYAPNYTPVVAVEKNSGAIVLCEVVEGSHEATAVKPAVEAARDVCGKPPDRILADTNLAAGENLQYIEEEKIEAYMPTGTDFRPSNPANRPDPTQPVAPDQWSKLPRRNKRLAKPAFVYDEEKDVYYCPMGKPLVFTSNGADTGSYTCPGKTDCPLANECVKGKAGHRKITRDSYQHLRDKVGRRMATEAGMKIYKKRAPVVEGVFGVIKHAMGVRRFLLRGLEKVRTEWTWVCTAFNLKKLLRIWALNPPGGGA